MCGAASFHYFDSHPLLCFVSTARPSRKNELEISNQSEICGKVEWNADASENWVPLARLNNKKIRKNWNFAITDISLAKSTTSAVQELSRIVPWFMEIFKKIWETFIIWLEGTQLFQILMSLYWMICGVNWSSFTRSVEWDVKQIKGIPILKRLFDD